MRPYLARLIRRVPPAGIRATPASSSLCQPPAVGVIFQFSQKRPRLSPGNAGILPALPPPAACAPPGTANVSR